MQQEEDRQSDRQREAEGPARQVQRWRLGVAG
jgi:hypothetical protein